MSRAIRIADTASSCTVRSTDSAMFAFVQSHNNFLTSARHSLDDVAWTATVASHATKLISVVRNVAAPTLPDAGSALECLRSSVFTHLQQVDIAAAINLAVSGPATPTAQGRVSLQQQEHLYLHNYLTAKDWASITNPNVGTNIRIEPIVDRCVAIGLLSMAEKTAQAITSLIVAASSKTVDRNESHDIMLALKQAFRAMRLRRAADCRPTLSKFPEDWSQFKAQCPGMYPIDAEPVPCPIDPKHIARMRGTVACRKTHTSLRTDAAVARSSSASSASQPPLVMQLVQAMFAMQQQQQHQRQPLDVMMLQPPRNRFAIADKTEDDVGPSASAEVVEDNAIELGTPAVEPAAVNPKPFGVMAVAASIQTALSLKSAKSRLASAEGKPSAKANAKANAKATAKATAKAKAKATTKVKTKTNATSVAAGKIPVQLSIGSKPTSKAKAKATAKLGCGKCRGQHDGCGQCRSPSFNGARWQRA